MLGLNRWWRSDFYCWSRKDTKWIKQNLNRQTTETQFVSFLLSRHTFNSFCLITHKSLFIPHQIKLSLWIDLYLVLRCYYMKVIIRFIFIVHCISIFLCGISLTYKYSFWAVNIGWTFDLNWDVIHKNTVLLVMCARTGRKLYGLVSDVVRALLNVIYLNTDNSQRCSGGQICTAAFCHISL